MTHAGAKARDEPPHGWPGGFGVRMFVGVFECGLFSGNLAGEKQPRLRIHSRIPEGANQVLTRRTFAPAWQRFQDPH